MKNCEKCQKLNELEDLSLEMYGLIHVLERALTCDEFEDGENINILYLVEIIKEKFDKISIIIEDIQYKFV